MFKITLAVTTLLVCTLLSAQEVYEKEFTALVAAKVKDGNISKVSKVSCQKGDCRLENVLLNSLDDKGESHETSIELIKLHNVKDFIEFKDGNGTLKNGESRSFAVALTDIKTDGHNLFFDKNEVSKEFGKKSAQYKYLKAHLDTNTDGQYSLTLKKEGKDVVIKDKGALSTGEFTFAINSQYTIKEGFEKLNEVMDTNPMGAMSYIVINSINIKIDNPKGFLKNLIYISYKGEMKKAKSDMERSQINAEFTLDGAKIHSEKSFVKAMLAKNQASLTALKQQDPMFDKIVNKNGQFEKKLQAVLAGESRHIYIKIENKKGLSLGDFITLFMGYAMQQRLTMDPEVSVSIK